MSGPLLQATGEFDPAGTVVVLVSLGLSAAVSYYSWGQIYTATGLKRGLFRVVSLGGALLAAILTIALLMNLGAAVGVL